VIPLYNNSDTIGEAIQSVISQTFPVQEIIVVDDGSTDGSADLVSEQFPDVRLVRQTNQGPASARNHGAQLAESDWIAFLDADDAWLPHKLALQDAVLTDHSELDFVCGGICRFDDDVTGDIQKTPEVKPITLESFVYANPVATSTVVLRKSSFVEVKGFDPQFKGPEDYDCWMRLSTRCRLAFIGSVISRYRRTEGSLSLSPETFLPQVLAVIEKAFCPEGVMYGRSEKKTMQARQYFACSWMASQQGQSRLAWKYYFEGLKRSPFGKVVQGRSMARLKLFRVLWSRHGLF
jgi:glycosyltransferase involved in cell wall biosynthesis